MVFKTLKQDEKVDRPLVVDNSVMMRWLFQDGADFDQIYAHGVLEAIGTQNLQVIVPYIWVYESAFVEEYYAKREAKTDEQCMTELGWLFDLAIVIRGKEKPVDLYEFSHIHGVSAYDASYVMLALDQSCPVATLDKTIIKARKKANYVVFEV